jgi:hypothetical protein
MQVTHSWMESMYHPIFDDMWYTMWFLTVEELWPRKVGGPQRMI